MQAAAAGGLGETAQAAELVEDGAQFVGGADGVVEVGAGLRVEVDAEFVGAVDVGAPHRPGWKVRVPYWAAHTTAASSVGHISSALRPLGKVMWAVGIQSGMFLGARFWKKFSPVTPSG